MSQMKSCVVAVSDGESVMLYDPFGHTWWEPNMLRDFATDASELYDTGKLLTGVKVEDPEFARPLDAVNQAVEAAYWLPVGRTFPIGGEPVVGQVLRVESVSVFPMYFGG